MKNTNGSRLVLVVKPKTQSKLEGWFYTPLFWSIFKLKARGQGLLRDSTSPHISLRCDSLLERGILSTHEISYRLGSILRGIKKADYKEFMFIVSFKLICHFLSAIMNNIRKHRANFNFA